MKEDIARRAERAKIQDTKFREMPDIVIKVVCKYRAELFFKISRKTKLARLFNAWTERMEGVSSGGSGGSVNGGGSVGGVVGTGGGKKGGESKNLSGAVSSTGGPQVNGTGSKDGVISGNGGTTMQFLFTHSGRMLEADQTPEDASMEDGDEILAVELMDLTEGPGVEDVVSGFWTFPFLSLSFFIPAFRRMVC